MKKITKFSISVTLALLLGTVANSYCQCTTTGSTITVTSGVNQTVFLQGTEVNVCPNESITLTSINLNRGTTTSGYNIILSQTLGLVSTNLQTIVGTTSRLATFVTTIPTVSGLDLKYTIRFNASFGCGSFRQANRNINNKTIELNNLSITGESCTSEGAKSIVLDGSDAQPDYVFYSVLKNNIPFITDIPTNGGTSIDFGTVIEHGTYTVMAENEFGCKRPQVGSLTIKETPATPTYTTTACGSNLISVKGSSATAAAGIIWTRSLPFSALDVITTTNNAILTYPTSVLGVQNFNVKSTFNGCESAATPNFSVSPLALQSISPSITAVSPNSCEVSGNRNLNFSIAGLCAGVWSPNITGEGVGNLVKTTTGSTMDGRFNPTSNGIKTYQSISITEVSRNCTFAMVSSLSYNLKAWISPYISFSNNGGNGPLNFSVASVTGAAYQWYNGLPSLNETSTQSIYPGATTSLFSGPSNYFTGNRQTVGIRIVNGHCISVGAYNVISGQRYRKEGEEETAATIATTEIILSPNPASDMVNINASYENYSLELTDLLGKKVLSKSDLSYASTLDISSLQQGTYFMSIFSPEGYVIKKFVKI